MHKFIELCTLLEKLESLQSRNEMSLVLSDYLKTCSNQEVEIISYLIQGRVAPMFVKSEFNYSEKSLINLLSEYTSLNLQSLRKESGDIGDTVFRIWKDSKVKGKVFDTKQIYEILWNIVNTSGTGSVVEKNKIVLECLQKLNHVESKYFVRVICGQLRLGLNVKTLLDVFSISITGDKSLKEDLERAYGVCADIGYIGKEIVNLDQRSVLKKLNNISTIPGTPVLSRLVQRVASFQELEKRFGNQVYVQPKFDGLRCQIHKWSEKEESKIKSNNIWKKYISDEKIQSQNLFDTKDETNVHVRLFTRNLEDVTEMFPEIVESARNLPQSSFLLDSEIVGWDYKNNTFLSYQQTMQRRRKYSIEKTQKEIPVRAFVFDILYLNGKPLVKVDTKERIGGLNKVLEDSKEDIVLADTKIVSVGKDIKEYFDKNVQLGLEGIIVKQLEGGYQPGMRNYEWIKVKKSIEKELVDTIDMVVVGYFKGSGRRSQLGVGAILGAIYNEEQDTFDAICKIGTGMSDDILKQMSKKFRDIESKNMPKNVKALDILIPDIWVLPKYVVTVDADEITKNISRNGKLIGGGLSLRFPRLVEFDRDKGVEDITTVEELVHMYDMKNIS